MFLSIVIFILFVYYVVCLEDDWKDHNPRVILQGLRVERFSDQKVKGLMSDDVSIYPETYNLTMKGKQFLRVHFENSRPQTGDWIAAYAVDGDIDFERAPYKFQNCSYHKDYLTTGKGSIEFLLYDFRSGYKFALFSGGFQHAQLLKQTTQPTKWVSPNYFQQVRLALTKDEKVSFRWTSYFTGDHSLHLIDETGKKFEVQGKRNVFKADDMCGSPANSFGWRDPGGLFQATFGCEFDKKYQYFITGSGHQSQLYSFTCPHPRKDSYSIVAFGDMGTYNGDESFEYGWQNTPSLHDPPSFNTSRRISMLLDELDFVLHIGDLAYSLGYALVNDEFFYQIEDVSSQIPWMVSPGNHEIDFVGHCRYAVNDSQGECGIPYDNLWTMPKPHPKARYYSFDYGLVHYVMMDTEDEFITGSPQHFWIQNDLSQVNRTKTPYIVLTGHRPLYIDSTYDGPPSSDVAVAVALQIHIEPLLNRYLVDMALFGHHHSYQRSCDGLKNNQCGQPDGVVYFVIGMAGRALSTNIINPQPQIWKQVRVTEFGVTRINVTPTHMELQFIGHSEGLIDKHIIPRRSF